MSIFGQLLRPVNSIEGEGKFVAMPRQQIRQKVMQRLHSAMVLQVAMRQLSYSAAVEEDVLCMIKLGMKFVNLHKISF
ncbi:hypothetical protein C9E85_06765 [Plesiomonas shigelloides]|nr:hypothetical protein C9E85_06765 [Plesiomonas shigelloides]